VINIVPDSYNIRINIMNNRTLTYTLAAVIILLLASTIFLAVSNSGRKKSLNAEKLRSESLLSEKLLVEKELDKLKNEYSALKLKSDTTDRLLAETTQKISDNQKRINSLSAENRSLKNSKKELDELQKVKADLENEAARLKSEYENLLARKNELQSSLTSLETKNRDLSQKLDKALMYDSDNFLVTATRGKTTERVVICSARAKKLNVNFEVPKSLAGKISFRITTPEGTTINPDDKSMSWTFPDKPRDYTASLGMNPGTIEESKQVTLTYARTKRLTKGIYKIELASDGVNIGTCRIQLR
jgi:myosin heavy subunit